MKYLKKSHLIIHYVVCCIHIIELFFSSSSEVLGSNAYSYFMESSVIGIDTLDGGLLGSCGEVGMLGVQDQKPLGTVGVSPLKDYSLFGNDSEDSDPEELVHLPPKAPVSSTTKPRALCFLNGEEVVYEAEGEAQIMCLRLNEASEPKILSSTMQDPRMRRVEIKENDLVVMIVGKTNEEELVKKAMMGKKLRSGITRKLSKELSNNIEARDKNARVTIIVAKISRGI
jgi:hypothetical protein